MKLNLIATQHHQWVGQMNWHNRTHLEAAGMIASEVAEACGEMTLSGTTLRFAEEIADVVLRVLDEAVVLDLDVDAALEGQYISAPAYEPLERSMIRLTAAQSPLINAARKADFPSMRTALIIILQHCLELDFRLSLNLERALDEKMAKNRASGNKGRLI